MKFIATVLRNRGAGLPLDLAFRAAVLGREILKLNRRMK